MIVTRKPEAFQTQRLSFLNTLQVHLLMLAVLWILTGCQTQNLPTPTPAQLAWQEAELGVLICYELHTFNEGRYHQPTARITPIDDPNQFNPSRLDVEQWVLAAKAAGARFAILTASHESGFRLWQSEVNPYCLKAIRWGDGNRDIVAEFAEACRKHDIEPGIYLGTRWNAKLGVYDFKVTERSTITQEAYNQLIEAEVEEICTNYGDWFEFWFDGGAHGPEQGGPDVLSIVEKYQPNALFYHNLQRADARWGGSETGTVSYPCWATFPYVSTGAGETAKDHISANNFELLKTGDPDGSYWMPAMSDAPLRGFGGHEWFWEPGDEHLIYPLEKLMDMYYKSVGRNSTLILGITPDTSGLIPEADVIRLAEFGEEVHSVVAIGRSPLRHGRSPQHDGPITTIIIQEDIQYGERVRKYAVEALIGANGRSPQPGRSPQRWITLTEGTSIGHKRIEKIEPIEVEKIRIKVLESIARPKIKSLSAF